MNRSRVLLAALLSLGCFASAADKPKITLDEFFNYVSFDAVQISPDGNSVVIGTDRADWDREIFQSDLWLYRGNGPDAGSLTRLTQSGHESSPHWSPDGRWIAFLSERSAPGGKRRDEDEESDSSKDDESEKSVAQVYLIRPDGGEAFSITSGEEEVHAFAWSPDSKTIYFATRIPWDKKQRDAHRKLWKDTVQYRAGERGDIIYSLEIATALENHAAGGTKETPKEQKEAGTTVTARQMTSTPWRVQQIAVAPDGRRLAFVTTSVSERQEKVDEFEIYSVDLSATSGEVKPKQLTHNEAFEQNLTWSNDNRHVFFGVEEGSVEGKYRDYQERLYWVDADTGDVQRWAADFDGSVGRHSLLTDGRILSAARLGTEVQLYSQENPKSAFKKHAGWAGTYAAISAAQNSSRVAFVYSSLDHPMEVYVADSVDKLEQAHPITAFNKLFTERDLPQGKPFQWTSDDGTKVEGMLLYPPGKFEAKNLPMLTFIHGGPADADGNHFEADWYQWDRLAATNGWLVFEPNYRGSTGYGDKFLMGIVPEIVSRPGKDILSGVDALVKAGIADPTHLTVGGYSYGGYMTNWLITQTDRFKAAVTGAGAVEHAGNWGNDDMTVDDAYFLGGRPWEASKRYYDEGALFQMHKVRTPTHLVAGGSDIRVAVSEDYLLDHALHSLGIPSTLLIFPGEGHSLAKNPWHGKIKVREELKWLQKYGGVGNTAE
ncbi:MAG TPA: prolyl oligopeptidase family serine peptidase [Terriglobales bacterium]|nr:prolyl oligopeptidase family serine peptidase [Terriglobales bacterium]